MSRIRGSKRGFYKGTEGEPQSERTRTGEQSGMDSVKVWHCIDIDTEALVDRRIDRQTGDRHVD